MFEPVVTASVIMLVLGWLIFPLPLFVIILGCCADKARQSVAISPGEWVISHVRNSVASPWAVVPTTNVCLVSWFQVLSSFYWVQFFINYTLVRDVLFQSSRSSLHPARYSMLPLTYRVNRLCFRLIMSRRSSWVSFIFQSTTSSHVFLMSSL